MRKQFKKQKYRKWIIAFLIVFILLQCGNCAFKAVNKALYPHINGVASSEVRVAALSVMKRTIASMNFDTDQLIDIEKDETGKIKVINYNTEKLNQILYDASQAAQNALHAASMGENDPYTGVAYYDRGIIYSIPLGMLTGFALLARVGPSINIHMKTVNSVMGQIEIKNSAYGLNNTMVQINLKLSVEMMVVNPFLLQSLNIDVSIPLVIQMVQGEIPNLINNPYLSTNP